MTDAFEFARSHALAMPALTKFALGMAILFGVPALSRRLRLPAVVGLLLSGVVIGPHVLDVFGTQRPVADFFADLGKLLLMFFAGLEVDLALFRRVQRKAVTFGVITTSLPLRPGYLGRPCVRLSDADGNRDGLAARVAHPAGDADHDEARREPTRALHRHRRGDRDVGHAVAGRVRDVRLDV